MEKSKIAAAVSELLRNASEELEDAVMAAATAAEDEDESVKFPFGTQEQERESREKGR